MGRSWEESFTGQPVVRGMPTARETSPGVSSAEAERPRLTPSTTFSDNFHHQTPRSRAEVTAL